MSRSGYSDDIDEDASDEWANIVQAAIHCETGQQLLREMRDAFDAMPEKRLITEELVTEDGERCALGVLGAARGLDLTEIDPEDSDHIAKVFGVPDELVREIEFQNDELAWDKTPERRWQRMRKWVEEQLSEKAPIYLTHQNSSKEI